VLCGFVNWQRHDKLRDMSQVPRRGDNAGNTN
jgi:hypothetical protein